MKLHVPMGATALELEIPGRVYLEARRAIAAAATVEAEDEVGISVLFVGLRAAVGLGTLADRGSLAAMAGVALDELSKSMTPAAVVVTGHFVARAIPIPPRAPVAPVEAPTAPAAPVPAAPWTGALKADEVPAYLRTGGAAPGEG